MTKKKVPVRFTGQHFTIDKVLIKDAIKHANITQENTVFDIGAGKGFITVHLLNYAKKIIAIENDYGLGKYLNNKFSKTKNVQIAVCDFRNFVVPKKPFKVVSNIPYSITAEVFKILMFKNIENFLEGTLVLQLQPAQKLFSSKIYNPYTVLYHTFFEIEILYEINPKSFSPPPTVESALLRIKRKRPRFNFDLKVKYLNFISYLLKKPDLTVRTALKSIFRKKQVRGISEKFEINLNSKIVSLSVYQWENCFIEMLDLVPEKLHPKKS